MVGDIPHSTGRKNVIIRNRLCIIFSQKLLNFSIVQVICLIIAQSFNQWIQTGFYYDETIRQGFVSISPRNWNFIMAITGFNGFFIPKFNHSMILSGPRNVVKPFVFKLLKPWYVIINSCSRHKIWYHTFSDSLNGNFAIKTPAMHSTDRKWLTRSMAHQVNSNIVLIIWW